MAPVSTSSGASAWKSTSGRRNGVPCWRREASTIGYWPSAWKVSPIAVMAGSVTWKMMFGKMPSTRISTSIGTQARYSLTWTSWMCSSANSSVGVPNDERW